MLNFDFIIANAPYGDFDEIAFEIAESERQEQEEQWAQELEWEESLREPDQDD